MERTRALRLVRQRLGNDLHLCLALYGRPGHSVEVAICHELTVGKAPQ